MSMSMTYIDILATDDIVNSAEPKEEKNGRYEGNNQFVGKRCDSR